MRVDVCATTAAARLAKGSVWRARGGERARGEAVWCAEENKREGGARSLPLSVRPQALPRGKSGGW